MATANDTKKFKKALEKMLFEFHSMDGIARAYHAVTTSKQIATRAVMVRALVASVEWTLINAHAAYMSSLSPMDQVAINDYQGIGYRKINHFLRTGEGVLDVPWGITDDLAKVMSIKSADVKRLLRAPETGKSISASIIAQATKSLTDGVQRSVGSTIATIQSIPLMIRIVRNAPALTRDLVLWRGERIDNNSFAPATTRVDEERRKYSDKTRDFKKGDTFKRADFTSFSMSVATSVGFMDSHKCCLYRLTLRSGQSALITNLESGFSEYEVLVSPATVFKVTGVTRIKSPVAEAEFTLKDIEIA